MSVEFTLFLIHCSKLVNVEFHLCHRSSLIKSFLLKLFFGIFRYFRSHYFNSICIFYLYICIAMYFAIFQHIIFFTSKYLITIIKIKVFPVLDFQALFLMWGRTSHDLRCGTKFYKNGGLFCTPFHFNDRTPCVWDLWR